MSASLQGTMVDPEALAAEQQQLLQQQAEAARAQAQQALSQYQGAAQQPPPQLNPLDVFLPTLVGNIASTLSQNPTYREHGHEEVKRRQSELLKTRADTLQALQDNFKQKADAADQAGDLQAKEQALLAHEKISKTYQQVLDQLKAKAAQDLEATRQKNRLEAIHARATENRTTNAAKPPTATQAATQEATGFPTRTTVSGLKWRDLSGLTGKEKNAVIMDSAKQGIPALTGPDATSLKEIQIARLNQQKLRGQIEGLLPSDWKQRPGAIAKIRMGQFLQSNKLAASFGAWREAAIQQLKAAAAVTGNRQAQRQFELVLKNDIPQLTDALPVALSRMEIVDQMLGSREDTLLKPDLSTLAKPSTGRIVMVDPNGKRFEVDPKEVKEAVAHGWKRAN